MWNFHNFLNFFFEPFPYPIFYFLFQIEHVQNKTIYDNKNEKQLIPRGVTVLVKRVPMPRGEKKVWREERVEKELSTQEVTSTSEEGRLDQV